MKYLKNYAKYPQEYNNFSFLMNRTLIIFLYKNIDMNNCYLDFEGKTIFPLQILTSHKEQHRIFDPKSIWYSGTINGSMENRFFNQSILYFTIWR